MTFAARSPRRKSTRWNVLPAENSCPSLLEQQFHVHPVVARILAARGWIAERPDLPPFLSPVLKSLRDPFELRDMDAAVERTLRAIKDGEKVCVYGDYDVDGVTSTTLLVETLRFLGVEPRIVIPHRMKDGYGMNVARIEEIATYGCTLIITVDTGITAVEEVRRAAELGMDVVVTDHHLAGEELPKAVALVNPNRADSRYEHGPLCGVGVAFKFAHALFKQARVGEGSAKEFLRARMDLVALGTIADVVPLLGENRVLVRHGLAALMATTRPGLKALMEVAGTRPGRLTPDHVAFGLAPRLNAAGRTGDATVALRLLLTQDPKEAGRLAAELERLNRERRAIEDDILDASREEAERAIGRSEGDTLVVHGTGWHLGVVGIVASRLTEMYDVPAIVLAVEEEHARGSARSIPGFDIHSALSACDQYLLTFGGHASAAGLRLHMQSLPVFREAINQHARDVFRTMDRTRTVDVDTEVEAGEVTWELYRGLQELQPFGEGNPAPLLLLRGVEAMYPPRIVGRDHLKLRLRAGNTQFDAIAFSRGHLKDCFQAGPADILFRPVENLFNGQRKLELEIQDARRGV